MVETLPVSPQRSWRVWLGGVLVAGGWAVWILLYNSARGILHDPNAHPILYLVAFTQVYLPWLLPVAWAILTLLYAREFRRPPPANNGGESKQGARFLKGFAFVAGGVGLVLVLAALFLVAVLALIVWIMMNPKGHLH